MTLASQAIYALLLAVPVACIVWTVTQEELFRELREALCAYQRQARSLWRRKIAYLPTCPYCFSHYIAAVFICLFDFRMLADDWRGYVVSLFSVVLFANVYISGYHLLRVALRRSRALADRAEYRAQRIRSALRVQTRRAKPWHAAGRSPTSTPARAKHSTAARIVR